MCYDQMKSRRTKPALGMLTELCPSFVGSRRRRWWVDNPMTPARHGIRGGNRTLLVLFERQADDHRPSRTLLQNAPRRRVAPLTGIEPVSTGRQPARLTRGAQGQERATRSSRWNRRESNPHLRHAEPVTSHLIDNPLPRIRAQSGSRTRMALVVALRFSDGDVYRCNHLSLRELPRDRTSLCGFGVHTGPRPQPRWARMARSCWSPSTESNRLVHVPGGRLP